MKSLLRRLAAPPRAWLRDRVSKLPGVDVPLEQIRCDRRPVYLREGYGGQPIGTFPPQQFFALHVAGQEREATASFERWYREQFERYGEVPKLEGGMRNGSLYTLVRRMRDDDRGPQALDDAIAERVRERFALLDSIRNDGFHPDRGARMMGVRSGGQVFLRRGHHRVAAIAALGQTHVPQVIVLTPLTLRALLAVGAS